MQRPPSRPYAASRVVLVLVAAVACTPGGGGGGGSGSTIPGWTEVSFDAASHLFSFDTGGWTSVPIPAARVWAGYSRLHMASDGTYTFTYSNGQGSGMARRYHLDDSGLLTLDQNTVPGLPSDHGTGGAYGRAGASDLRSPGSTPDVFLQEVFVSNGSVLGSGSLLGTSVVAGPVELAGDWHLLSLHLILEQSAPSPDSVGRGARGSISISTGAPGTPRSISGIGSQGTNGLAYGGTIRDQLANGGDGRCDLTVSYQLDGQSADDRVMLAAARPAAVFGLDAYAGDGEAGHLLLVRKFDGAAPPDPARVAGRFFCAGRTLIVDPSNARGLQFRGLVTLAASGAFDLEVAPLGSIAGYSVAGTWTLAADGGLTLALATGAETWFAAIDRGYNTLVFVDDAVESGSAPRLSLGFGVREKTPN